MMVIYEEKRFDSFVCRLSKAVSENKRRLENKSIVGVPGNEEGVVFKLISSQRRSLKSVFPSVGTTMIKVYLRA